MPLKQKKLDENFCCDDIEGEKFYAPGADDITRFNWWEIFCFPCLLCARLCDYFVSLCAGTNQCLVYWMMIQWIMCKINRFFSPECIACPYYFYMFGQIILLTLFFILVWVWFGESVIIPYFVALYEAFSHVENIPSNNSVSRMRFRKYCFRKGEIFINPTENSSILTQVSLNKLLAVMAAFIVRLFANKVF